MPQQGNQAPPSAAPPPTPTTGIETAPKVTSVVPSIFVPLDEDITQPFEAPRDRIERAKRVLESVEFHRNGVKQGILHLTEHERKRILREAELWEAEHGPPEPAGLPAEEADAMIRNMSAPAEPGVNYNAALCDLRPNFNAPIDRPGRLDTVRQLERVVEDSITQLAGYEAHMDGIKKRWEETLEKEQRMMDEKFGTTSKPPVPPPPPGGPSPDGDTEMGDAPATT